MSYLMRKILGPYMQAAPDAVPAPNAAAAVAPEPVAPVVEGAPDAEEEVINWESLSSEQPGEDDVTDPSVPPAAAPAATPAAPVAPATPATPPATPATTAPAAPTPPDPATPAAAPAQPATTPPATPPAQPATPPVSDEERARQAGQARKDAEARLAEKYAAEMTEEDKAELLTNPEKVMPRLLAKAMIDGVQVAQVLARESVLAEVPQVIEHRRASVEAERTFFATNPDLAKQEFGPVVAKMAQTARSMLPKGTTAQVSELAAKLSRTALGLATPAPSGAPASTPPAPAAVARPFTPAAPGGSSPGRPAASATPPENPWADLASDD